MIGAIYRGNIPEGRKGFAPDPQGRFYVCFCDCGYGVVGTSEHDSIHGLMLSFHLTGVPSEHLHERVKDYAHVQIAPEAIEHFYDIGVIEA